MGTKKKRRSAGRTTRSAENEDSVAKSSAAPNELHEHLWAVVSFKGVVSSNLTYDEAENVLAENAEKNTPGLCIVTEAVAGRLHGDNEPDGK